MAISNYTNLQTSLADWLSRPGDATIAAIAPDAIALSETAFNYGHSEPGEADHIPPLRTQAMETRSTSSVTTEYWALPADFLEFRSIKLNSSPEAKIEYVTPNHFAERAASYVSGKPIFYTIVANQLRLGPSPTVTSPQTVEIAYYAKIPPLASNATNWLLTQSPNAYLFMSLFQTALYIGDDAQAQKWFPLARSSVLAVVSADTRVRYSGGPLTIRALRQTP